MQYVMSDIHGCRTAFRKALEVTGFSPRDTLYVLGDVIDRGEDPIGVLQDMMVMDNVIPLLGNHEYMAVQVLPVFSREITEESIASLKEEDLTSYLHWTSDGGDITVRQFAALPREEQEAVLEYLMEFSLYEEVSAGGRDYILVHAGLDNFRADRPLEDYALHELIFHNADPERIYDPKRYLVTGHTPTLLYPDERKGRIIEENMQIRIDCGCVFGGALGVYCLDDGRKFYISRKGELLV